MGSLAILLTGVNLLHIVSSAPRILTRDGLLRKYDVEAWMPGRQGGKLTGQIGQFGKTTHDSTCGCHIDDSGGWVTFHIKVRWRAFQIAQTTRLGDCTFVSATSMAKGPSLRIP
eukprot:COSAG05_NODE_46_length_25233_cov_40.235741_1_plen_114_part_00